MKTTFHMFKDLRFQTLGFLNKGHHFYSLEDLGDLTDILIALKVFVYIVSALGAIYILFSLLIGTIMI